MESFLSLNQMAGGDFVGVTILLILVIFCGFRLCLLLMFLQQEEYENDSFLKLTFGGLRLVDKKLCVALAALFAISFALPFKCSVCSAVLVAGLCFIFALREHKYMAKAKKKLVLTWRAKRLLLTALILSVLLIYILAGVFVLDSLLVVIITILLLPGLLVLANIILRPVEAYGRRKFVRAAARKIAESDVTVIGITGSYGKTSVKHFLAHILATGASVLFTPGSVNTLLGVSRVINTQLKPSHQFFIVEMGAYYIGSIKKVCDLVAPKHGIITAIGQAHFARFKTKENVAKAKFELADAVGKKGTLILNAEQIEKRFFALADKTAIPVGDGYDFYVSDVKQDKNGLWFVYHGTKEKMTIKAPIYGEHHAQNIALAITMALKLGMPKATIVAAIRTLPQVAHRLEVKKTGSATLIDDGYNSNPKGFASALSLLDTMRTKQGRSVLITPGMIEMGPLHDDLHFELGKKAGEVADILVAVVPDRLAAFIKGYEKTAGKNGQVIKVAKFAEAKKWMAENLGSEDVVLIENDLPDTYEKGFAL